MSKQLSGKVTVVAGSDTSIGIGIVKSFLLHNAIVIAPLSQSEAIDELRRHLSGIPSGKLVTLLLDTIDYAKASDIAEYIKQAYGYIDLVVTAFNNNTCNRPLMETDICEWQKAIDENVTAHFITGRVALQLMKEQRDGMFVTICNAAILSGKSYASLNRIITENQTELSVLFAEEVKPYNIRYYQLFVRDMIAGPPANEQNPTPEMTGEHIVKLYHRQVAHTGNVFQHFPALSLPVFSD
jgi:NAD(P)-dependent dehydrogenase (short-subunit alcohol dehydrogenase family)